MSGRPHLDARSIAVVSFTLILLTTPLAGAQSVSDGNPSFQEPGPAPEGTDRITFYGYVFGSGLFEPMPMNTQYPWGVADYASSLLDYDAPGVYCGPAPHTQSCDDYTINKIALFTTAGPVQVKNRQEFDYGKLHNENGMSQDVLLDTTQDVTSTIFMSASKHAWLHNTNETPCLGGDPPQNVPCLYPYWRWHTGVNPQFQVRTWLYAMELGDHGMDAYEAPPVEDKWVSGDRGILIAEGESEPVDLMSLDGTGGNERVWRFDINMGPPKVESVSRLANLVVVYSWHNVLPDGTEIGLGTFVRVNTGEFFPTQLSLPVKNGFTVELVAPRVIHDKLVVLTVMNTPWGSYDLDPESVDVTITDASGRPVDTDGLRAVADYSVAHGAHYSPINITFVWDHKAAGLPAGAYRVTVSAANYQGSASDALTAFIEVDENGQLTRVEPGRADVTTYSDADFQRFMDGAGDAASGDASRGTGLPDLPVLDARAPDAPDASARAPPAAEAAFEAPGAPAPAALAALAAAATLAGVIVRRHGGGRG